MYLLSLCSINLPIMISSFLLFHFIFFFFQVKSQRPSENIIPSQDSVSNFQPSLPVVIGMLAIMFTLTFVLLLYAKFCHHQSSSSSATSHHIRDGLVRSRGVINPLGVDRAVVEFLPFFKFSSLRGSKQGLECSVCLSKFRDEETLRLLPKCKHGFHIDCIDTWLEKHATCPLCRQRVSADDLSEPVSTSFRFSSWNEESTLEVYVEREPSRAGSSRFGNIDDPIPKNAESRDCDYDRFKHTITVSDCVVFKNRWSNVTSSDLVFLNYEMLNHESNSDPNFGSGSRSKARLDPNEKRSMSEIVFHPRLISHELRNKDSTEERMKSAWLPIARKTVQWFANRDTAPPVSISQGLNHPQTSNV